ncbi:MAG: Xaa-Pro peptidase family protein [Candidatus Bipolaricaulota bacterium]|nr:Xaa-Pro peptidase family protein [Candidatus Bipolaricaulota bacterium]
MDYEARLGGLKKRLAEQNIDVLALLPGANLTYLTGITKDLSERPLVYFLSSSRSARPTILLPHLEVETFSRALPYKVDFVAYTDEEGYAQAFTEASNVLNLGGKTIAVEERSMRLLELRQIEQNAHGTEVVEADHMLSQKRMVKDSDEIEAIRTAIKVSEESLRATCAQVRVGMSERDVQMILNMEMLKNGADGHGFPPIVLSGPRAALPHGVAGDRKLQEGDCLLIDFGFLVGTYSADITRTFSIGTSTPAWKEIYETVKAANETARSLAGPGTLAEEVDAAARKVIVDAGYGKYFTHRTGHGLGLDIHEPPYIVSGNKTVLQPGVVFTVEPGIYIADKVGVRIEDDIVITEDGAETLSTYPHELTSL